MAEQEGGQRASRMGGWYLRRNASVTEYLEGLNRRLDWNQSECIFEINFTKKHTATKSVNNTVCIINSAVS